MSERQFEMSGEPAISFGQRLASSAAFKDLFRDGMALVEDSATYLDGPGRQESRQLERGAALAYATESMRLTTRLMQLASWLLLQRAVNEGELTAEQAASDKSKIRLSALGAATPAETLETLPEGLKDLIARAMRLQDRVIHMDRLLHAGDHPAADAPANSVVDQLARLQSAFTLR
jgi:regulator of CtrA degradation